MKCQEISMGSSKCTNQCRMSVRCTSQPNKVQNTELGACTLHNILEQEETNPVL
jgi:hypothetical protein